MDTENELNSTDIHISATTPTPSSGYEGKFNILSYLRGIQFVAPVIIFLSCICACLRRRRRRLEHERRLAEAAAVAVDNQGSGAVDMNAMSALPVNMSTVGGVLYPRQTTLSSGFSAGATAPSSGYGFGSPYGESAAPSAPMGGYTYTNMEFKY